MKPPIRTSDLHAAVEEARVERIWDRLKQEVTHRRGRSSRFAYPLAVGAAFAAFIGGVCAGRVLWREQGVRPSLTAPAIEPAGVDVLAAGTKVRTYPLPGGGTVTLTAGSVAEMEVGAGGSVHLRLLLGEVGLDTAPTLNHDVSIALGDATINVAPRSTISVRQRADSMDVRVVAGGVLVSSPAGAQSLRPGEQLENVPTSAVRTLSPPSPVTRAVTNGEPTRISRTDSKEPVDTPSWMELHNAYDDDAAMRVLLQEPGGVLGAIRRAQTASELMAMSDVLRFKRHAGAVTALHRVADELGTSTSAQTAAYLLSKHYEAIGQPDLAKKYREQASTGVFAASSLCDVLRVEQRAGRTVEARARAAEYLVKYPSGSCKELAKSIAEENGPPVQPLPFSDPVPGDERPAPPADPAASAPPSP